MKTIEDICKHCKHYLSCLRGAEFKTCKLKQSPHERALDFGLMLRSHGESEDSYTCGAASYEKGAEEQKAIDIDKACEWLKENIYDYIAVGNTDFGKPYDIDLVADELFEDFRKAMGE